MGGSALAERLIPQTTITQAKLQKRGYVSMLTCYIQRLISSLNRHLRDPYVWWCEMHSVDLSFMAVYSIVGSFLIFSILQFKPSTTASFDRIQSRSIEKSFLISFIWLAMDS